MSRKENQEKFEAFKAEVHNGVTSILWNARCSRKACTRMMVRHWSMYIRTFWCCFLRWSRNRKLLHYNHRQKWKAVAEAILKTKEEMHAQSLAEKEARAEKAEQLAMQENELRRKAEEDAEKQWLAREQAEATIKELNEPPAPDVAPSDLEPKEEDDTVTYLPFSNLLRCPLEKKEALIKVIGEHIQENHIGWTSSTLTWSKYLS